MKKNKKYYIFVSGGVMSSLGKGTVAASVGALLKANGLRVTPIKFENYLNVDAGTINPLEHGDPFLCADGTEADMDLGSYERFLGQEVGRNNFVTMGRIYYEVINKERQFGYQGEDVEAIPYIVDHIIQKIDTALSAENSRIGIIELGGTVGEYQNVLYYEANRLLKFRYPDQVVHLHVSYIPIPPHIGEPKTKPAQLSVKMLNSMGILPDFLISRSPQPLDERRKERLAMFCNVKPERIIDSPDLDSVYKLPLVFKKQHLGEKIINLLGIKAKKKASLVKWQDLAERIDKTASKPKKTLEIGIVGKYFQSGKFHLADAYAALIEAIKHAQWALGYKVNLHFIPSPELEKKSEKEVEKILSPLDGIIVPIGWGKRGAEGKIRAIKFARQNKVPFLGLCYGMQLAVVEFARNVVGLRGANTVENQPDTPHPVIHLIPEQKKILEKRAYGGTMRLGEWLCKLKPNTLAAEVYRKYGGQFINRKELIVSERHRHRYEFNDAYARQLSEAGLIISGRSVAEGLVEIIELSPKQHPFFLATQGHPEYKSTPFKPHPFFLAFLEAASSTPKSKS